jgi:hypothetical protein
MGTFEATSANVSNSPSFWRSIEHCHHIIELHASRHAETGTFVTFIYEKDSEQLLWHVTGTDQDDVILQSLAWSEKNSRHHPVGSSRRVAREDLL